MRGVATHHLKSGHAISLRCALHRPGGVSLPRIVLVEVFGNKVGVLVKDGPFKTFQPFEDLLARRKVALRILMGEGVRTNRAGFGTFHVASRKEVQDERNGRYGLHGCRGSSLGHVSAARPTALLV